MGIARYPSPGGESITLYVKRYAAGGFSRARAETRGCVRPSLRSLYFKRVTELELHPDAAVLDLAAGTGKLTRAGRLAAKGGAIGLVLPALLLLLWEVLSRFDFAPPQSPAGALGGGEGVARSLALRRPPRAYRDHADPRLPGFPPGDRGGPHRAGGAHGIFDRFGAGCSTPSCRRCAASRRSRGSHSSSCGSASSRPRK